MLSTDTRSLRLSKAWGQPIHILRPSSLPRVHLSTPPKSRRSLNTVSNSKTPPSPSLSRLIFNRTYYHKTYFSPPPPPPPPPPPSSGATTATIWTLIGLNTAIFALWQYALHQPPQPHRPHRHDDRNPIITPSLLEAHTTLSWPNLHADRPWTLLTSAFSHQDPWHFAFNMLSLKTFATLLTHIPGIRPPHIISLATGSALAASFAFLSHDSSRRQNQDQGPTNNPIGRTISGPDRQITRGIPGASPGNPTKSPLLRPRRQRDGPRIRRRGHLSGAFHADVDHVPPRPNPAVGADGGVCGGGYGFPGRCAVTGGARGAFGRDGVWGGVLSGVPEAVWGRVGEEGEGLVR